MQPAAGAAEMPVVVNKMFLLGICQHCFGRKRTANGKYFYIVQLINSFRQSLIKYMRIHHKFAVVDAIS